MALRTVSLFNALGLSSHGDEKSFLAYEVKN
jgi:hypothetical protein